MTDDPDNVVPIKAKPKRTMSPEHKAKWKASVMKTNNKPASGQLAQGAGWGGAANGPGAPVFHDTETGRALRAIPRISAEDLEALNNAATYKYAEIMLTSENQPLQLAAAEKLKDRIEGKPTQRVVTADATESLRQWMVDRDKG